MTDVAHGEAAAWVGPNPRERAGRRQGQGSYRDLRYVERLHGVLDRRGRVARALIDGDALKWFAERIEADAGKVLQFLDERPIEDC